MVIDLRIDKDIELKYVAKLKRDIIIKNKEQLDNGGVYVFRNKNNEIVYIGLTINFYNRLKNPEHNMWMPMEVPDANSVETFEIEDDNVAYLVESMLIDSIKPKHNSRSNSGYCPYKNLMQDSNYNNIATEVAQQIRRSLI